MAENNIINININNISVMKLSMWRKYQRKCHGKQRKSAAK
jgi:hypothetical protein